MKTKIIISLTILLLFGTSIFLAYAGANTLPTGYLDSALYQKGQLLASGWAADKEDGSPVNKVMVYVDNKFIGDARLGLIRVDVPAAMKNPNWKNSGWNFSKPLPLSKGVHVVSAVAIDKQGEKTKLNTIKVTIE